MAAPLILIFAGCAVNAAAQNDAPTFRAGVADVRVDVQVTEGNKPLDGLVKDDFLVFDEDRARTLDSFSHGAEPISLLMLLDISGSMTRYLELMASQARGALALLKPGDKVAIMVFGRRSELHREFSDNIAESARQIGEALHGHDVGAGTAINSAALDAAAYIKDHAAAAAGRRAILIVTDNQGLNYQAPDELAIRELFAADTVFNAIVNGRGIRPGPPRPGRYTNPDFTPADVFHIAEETGGEAIKATHSTDVLRDMIENIRSRYLLTYVAPPAAAGAFRHVRVELTPEARQRHPRAAVRARAGYYAGAS